MKSKNLGVIFLYFYKYLRFKKHWSVRKKYLTLLYYKLYLQTVFSEHFFGSEPSFVNVV